MNSTWCDSGLLGCSLLLFFCKTGNPNGEGLPQWTAITKDNLDNAPVMKIDVESAEVASPEKENAYRTLEKFYRSKK